MVCGRHKIENIFLWFQLSNIHFDYLNCTINQFAEIERNILFSLCVFGQTYFSTRNRKRYVYRGAFPTFMGATSYLHVIRKIINFTTSSLCVCVCGLLWLLFIFIFRFISSANVWDWEIYLKVLMKTLQTKHGNDNETRTFCGIVEVKGRLTVCHNTNHFMHRQTRALNFNFFELRMWKKTADPGYFLRVNKIANMNCQYKELENYAFFWNAVGMCGPVTHRNSILGVGLLFITATPKNNSFPKTRLETYTTFGYYNVFVWLRFASDGRRM